MGNRKEDTRLDLDEQKTKDGPVECLGMTFPSDEARREHFLEILREKLQDPDFRSIEGFPIGEDEDILALSDPPYYTACPNPFIEDFIEHYGTPYDPETDDYHREPFAADVSEGKRDAIYRAHSYHTKVPPKAIVRYMLHYTEPGDIVLDGFCGTGMTGVASQMCAEEKTVESLGYKVQQDGTVLAEDGASLSKLGARPTIQNDLSPLATYIAAMQNHPADAGEFESEAQRVADEVREEHDWMYLTLHQPSDDVVTTALRVLEKGADALRADSELSPHWGRINYVVWSDVFICPECGGRIVYWNPAVSPDESKVLSEFECEHCHSLVGTNPSKSSGASKLEHAMTQKWDPYLGRTIEQAQQTPVMIDYETKEGRYQKAPDAFDTALIDELENRAAPGVPIAELPGGYNLSQPIESHGFTHVHHFYTGRNLHALSAFSAHSSREIMQVLTSFLENHANKRNRYLLDKNHPQGTTGGPLSNTLYIPPLSCEVDIPAKWEKTARKVVRALEVLPCSQTTMMSTHSTTAGCVPRDTVDYIFTDPPFGGNIMYSEVNFLWESWLSVWTSTEPEAIQNETRGKDLFDYQRLIGQCMATYYAALRPGRWMTVVFHNSKNAIWRAIQEGLQTAGFVVADVRVLDKKHSTIYQDHAPGAVKQDLVISAYKPNGGLQKRFELEAGTEKGVWDFIRTHLLHLPVFVSGDGRCEPVGERYDYLLYDRMVAFHVQRGVTVPLSAAEFYAGLRERFPERDGMFFLPEQVAEYDRNRMQVEEVQQLQMFVTDESSAIQWLRQELREKPRTFQDLQPEFMQQVQAWEKHEEELELSDILRENFLRYEGDGEVPSQIHAYLSSNYHDLRNLEKDDPALVEKAKDRWYVPDPNKEADLEKIRHKSLIKEFEEYRESKGKLKTVRTEALRAGFKDCWQNGDYQTIVDVAERLPDEVVQEDSALLMYYDNALMRTEG